MQQSTLRKEILAKLCVTGQICAPVSNSDVEVLTSSTSECDLIGGGVFKGCEAEMRSLGWALIQYHWCPYKKRRVGHRHTYREDHL